MPACSGADTRLFATLLLPGCQEEEAAGTDRDRQRVLSKGLKWGNTQLLLVEPAPSREGKVKELDGLSVLKLPKIF